MKVISVTRADTGEDFWQDQYVTITVEDIEKAGGELILTVAKVHAAKFKAAAQWDGWDQE